MSGWMGRTRDDGVALVASVGVVMVVGILMLVVTVYAIGETRQSGFDRQRSSAVAIAEGRLDTTLARIQGATVASLPCGETVTDTASAPDTVTTTTTVTYYAGATAVACPIPSGVTVTQALVRSSSVSNSLAGQRPVQRTVESLVQLHPVGAGLNKAIFGNSGVQLKNQGDLYGSAPGLADADIYTNGDFTCENNGTYRGSVYAQGTATMTNQCNVSVDVHTKNGVTGLHPGITIGGGIQVSSGNVRLKNGISVAGTVRASGTIRDDGGGSNWNGCNTAGKCYPGATVTAPPATAFPQLPWDSATRTAWEGQGYTNYVENNNCSSDGQGNGPGRWLLDNGQSITTPTILRTSCQVIVEKSAGVIDLSNHVAVFADGGVSFKNSVVIRSTDTTQRNLYLIQPYNAVTTHPCTTEAIVLSNQVTVESTVSDLLYSPCTIHKNNNSTHYGQIYAGGQAIFDNRLTLHYDPLPVFGLVGGEPSSYKIDILYKRETV